MKNLFENLSKGVTIVFYIICVLLFFNTCNSCNTKRQVKKLNVEFDSVKTELVSVKNELNEVKNNVPTAIDNEIQYHKTLRDFIGLLDRKPMDYHEQQRQTSIVDSLQNKKIESKNE